MIRETATHFKRSKNFWLAVPSMSNKRNLSSSNAALYAMLSAAENLENLTLHGCPISTDHPAAAPNLPLHTLTGAKSRRSLCSLDLTNLGIQQEELVRFLKADSPTLEYLKFENVL